jgi:hypothetical protein
MEEAGEHRQALALAGGLSEAAVELSDALRKPDERHSRRSVTPKQNGQPRLPVGSVLTPESYVRT